MTGLLNKDRPPVFCPGCAHERITHALDKAFQEMNLTGNEIAIVSDIGCSGLFDTFFRTHAFHGLHGRALTYAAGIKLARPELNVIVTMGDGGLGIGGAHLLAACRRNIDLTLLILNNFNFGMTGGQYSATTPAHAQVGSGFLNQLEPPLDPCRIGAAAGAPYLVRCSAYDNTLSAKMAGAIRYNGFSLLDIHGVCPGRYTKKNRLTPKSIEEAISEMPPFSGEIEENVRPEYGAAYREKSASLDAPSPRPEIEAEFDPPSRNRQEILLLGGAGGRIITAGEILCMAGMTAGLNASQKNEYNITVLRGPSISEVILSEAGIGYTAIDQPEIILAVGQEGVDRAKKVFDALNPDGMVIAAADLTLPECAGEVIRIDFKEIGIKEPDRALAALAVLAGKRRAILPEMLKRALEYRFKGPINESSMKLVEKVLWER